MAVTVDQARKSTEVIIKDANGNVQKVIRVGDQQIGLDGFPVTLILTGGIDITERTVNVRSNEYVFTLTEDDIIIYVNYINNLPPVIFLPTNVDPGKLIIVKDVSGNAASYNIFVQTTDGLLIDGTSTATISTGYGSTMLVRTETGWGNISSGGGSGGSGAPADATYITISNDATLTNERKLVVSSSLTLTDHGANNNIDLDLSDTTVTPNTYTNTTLTVDQKGRITAASNGAAATVVTGTWRDPGNTFVTTGSVSIDSSNRSASSLGSDVFFFVSGSATSSAGSPNRHVSLFGGDVVASGSVTAKRGFSGSLTQLDTGVSAFVGQGIVAITTASNGQVIISGSSASSTTTSVTGTWRDPGNTFVTTGSVSIDTGNRTATSLGTDVFFFVSGSVTSSATDQKTALFGGRVFSSGTINALQGFSGSLTQLTDGRSAFIGQGAVSILTSSTNQVIISSSGATVVSRYGTYSARPNPGNTGNDYFATDSPVSHWIDNGSKWQPLIMGQVLGVEPLLSATLTGTTGLGQGTATLTQLSGALLFKDRGATDINIAIFVTPFVPTSSSYFEAAFSHFPEPQAATGFFHFFGICAYESSTNKLFAIEVVSAWASATPTIIHYIEVDSYTSLTGSSVSTKADTTGLDPNAPIFLRIRSGSSANIVAGDYSRDRINWICISSVTSSTVFTGRFNQFGIMGWSETGTGTSTNVKSGRAIFHHMTSGTFATNDPQTLNVI